MSSQIFFKSKKAFIEFIKNKSDFAIEIISQTDEWIVFKCKAKINKPRCGTGGGTEGGKRMTLNKLAEIVLNLSNTVETLRTTVETLRTTVENLSNTVETGFAEIRQDIKTIKEDVTVLKKDVSDIKKCPTIQKELFELAD